MVVGFDAYHGGGKSIGAMVATTSASLAKYFSTVTRFDAFQEVSTKMGGELKSKLLCCQKLNEMNEINLFPCKNECGCRIFLLFSKLRMPECISKYQRDASFANYVLP